MRLSISSFAGTARTLVAVGTFRLSSMLVTVLAATPLNFTSSAPADTGAGAAAGLTATAFGAAAAAGAEALASAGAEGVGGAAGAVPFNG
ncbi:hypothetical protein GCM10027589_11650 [Actinocorallia lasiicapitis]